MNTDLSAEDQLQIQSTTSQAKTSASTSGRKRNLSRMSGHRGNLPKGMERMKFRGDMMGDDSHSSRDIMKAWEAASAAGGWDYERV